MSLKRRGLRLEKRGPLTGRTGGNVYGSKLYVLRRHALAVSARLTNRTNV